MIFKRALLENQQFLNWKKSSFDGDFEGNHVWLLGAIINHQGYSDLPMIYPWFTQDTISWNSEMSGSRLVFFSQACGEEEVEAVEMAEVHRGQGLMVKDIEKQ